MVETIKLYNQDPYLTTFQAKILNSNGIEIILDKTAFYPLSGGQSGDHGTINGVNVIDTQIENGTIKHILKSESPFKNGEVVEGNIDWKRRYATMRLHSASHIMEYLLLEHYGPLERIGSSVDNQKDRSDYLYEGRLMPEDLKSVEHKINQFILEEHVISISEDTEKVGMRIWKCGPITEYCGGTHVRNTREIGLIKLKRKNTGKSRERVETSLINT